MNDFWALYATFYAKKVIDWSNWNISKTLDAFKCWIKWNEWKKNEYVQRKYQNKHMDYLNGIGTAINKWFLCCCCHNSLKTLIMLFAFFIECAVQIGGWLISTVIQIIDVVIQTPIILPFFKTHHHFLSSLFFCECDSHSESTSGIIFFKFFLCIFFRFLSKKMRFHT